MLKKIYAFILLFSGLATPGSAFLEGIEAWPLPSPAEIYLPQSSSLSSLALIQGHKFYHLEKLPVSWENLSQAQVEAVINVSALLENRSGMGYENLTDQRMATIKEVSVENLLGPSVSYAIIGDIRIKMPRWDVPFLFGWPPVA